jgi:hypothetical protein
VGGGAVRGALNRRQEVLFFFLNGDGEQVTILTQTRGPVMVLHLTFIPAAFFALSTHMALEVRGRLSAQWEIRNVRFLKDGTILADAAMYTGKVFWFFSASYQPSGKAIIVALDEQTKKPVVRSEYQDGLSQGPDGFVVYQKDVGWIHMRGASHSLAKAMHEAWKRPATPAGK